MDIAKRPVNYVIDIINGLIDGINGIQVPDFIPIFGGMSANIPNIPRLKVGMDYVPADYFPAYLDEGEAVLTKQENAMYRQLGGLQGMFALQNQQSVAPAQSQAEIDYERIGKETAKAMKGVVVQMDKKPVGKIIAPVVNDELGKINSKKT